ncbi:HupE/UreJ family protein [uncultured Piscinibacter sp.]|uniref:HupE/UreJ family protein n=1 Tax=uncultured Piscinibacter sp. TaxID=1131835 RepID=UPI00261F89EE|nr:HupE/UreJ family protein [uncultured Piscinibacter sp.]
MSCLLRCFAAAALALGLASTALAHKPSDSYLTLTQEGTALHGQWDIALRDLDVAIGLDADGNGEITWGELRVRHAEVAAYALARLAIEGDGQPCVARAGEQLVDHHTDGAYTVLRFEVGCPALPKQLRLEYRLFADIDPQHRGLLRLEAGGATRTAVLGPDASSRVYELANPSRAEQFADYLREGVWHIWIGFDHILFLLALLLPAVLAWRPAGWQPAESFRDAFVEVVKIVSAFTVAHSVTLTLATLGLLTLPSRPVEATIAASVVLAALNNLRPLFERRRWAMAFGFGLVHGFGFASVLADLGLPQDALALALLGFNVGVEVGQLAIVAAFLPLAFALSDTRFYQRVVLAGGSLAIALLAALWFVERAFDLSFMPL